MTDLCSRALSIVAAAVVVFCAVAVVLDERRQSQLFHEAVAMQHQRSAMFWVEILELMEENDER